MATTPRAAPSLAAELWEADSMHTLTGTLSRDSNLDAVQSSDPAVFPVAFSHVPGIGPVRTARLTQAFGDLATAWRAPSAALAAVLDQRSHAALMHVRATLDPVETLGRIRDARIHVITQDQADYPSRLAEIGHPPTVLYVLGDASLLDTRAIAVVGTRRASEYGRRAARQLAGDLAAAGATVVSGMALGIDTEAHQAALDAGGKTVAILGCGVDLVYPPRNRGLYAALVAHGAVVSEYPPGTPPDPGNFPARNRLVSGLAVATLVVEAGIRSGALITAAYALEQGREVWAVPGSLFSPQSAGTHALLAAGAGLATSAGDMLAALDLDQLALQNAVRRALPDDPGELAILTELGGESIHIDELARAMRLPVSEVARRLTLMELKGLVRELGGLRYSAGR